MRAANEGNAVVNFESNCSSTPVLPHYCHRIGVRGHTALVLMLGLSTIAIALGCKSRATASLSAISSSHAVQLSWNPSTSDVIGYDVYRGTLPGGPYTKLNSSPVVTTIYIDGTVRPGETYFYVVSAVDSNNVESAPSNEIIATIPTP